LDEDTILRNCMISHDALVHIGNPDLHVLANATDSKGRNTIPEPACPFKLVTTGAPLPAKVKALWPANVK
jgi:hypothetical protein